MNKKSDLIKFYKSTHNATSSFVLIERVNIYSTMLKFGLLKTKMVLNHKYDLGSKGLCKICFKSVL